MRLLMALGVLLVVGCSNPRDTIIPDDPGRLEADLQPSMDRLSPDDRNLLASYLSRIKAAAALTGQPVPSGISVGQAIEREREYQQAEAARQAEDRLQQLRREQARKELERRAEALLSVTLASKAIGPADLGAGSRSEQARLAFDLRNVGDQAIVRVAGTIRLSDSFSSDLLSVHLDYPESILPGTTARWESSVVLSLFGTTGQRLRNVDISQIRATFTPELVELVDGTKLQPAASSN